MAVDMNLSIAAAKAMVDALVDLADGGTAANPRLRVYDGSQPASPDVAVGTQTLLAEIDLGTAAVFGSATTSGNNAKATSSVLPKTCTSATASGTATWARLVDKDATAVWDGSVGTSSADFIIDNASIAAGQQVKLNSWYVQLDKTAG